MLGTIIISFLSRIVCQYRHQHICFNCLVITNLFRFEDKNRGDEAEVEYEAGVVDSFFNPRAWMKYTNPMEWFRGGMSTTEGVIMSVVILVALVLGLVLAKICSCCSCFVTVIKRLCCCAKKTRVKREQEPPAMVTKQTSRSRLDGQALSMI